MHDEAVSAATPEAAQSARHGDARALREALVASRNDTLATFAAWERALPGLQVPRRAELNPPLWELGHIGWFQEFWVGRNPVRDHGHRADPEAPRSAPRRAGADALYHSSHVPHDARWSLPLPDAEATRDDLAAQLEQTLRLLDGGTPGAARAQGAATRHGGHALYFHRLALLHEDMHHEAALYMAQGLGIVIDDARWQPRRLPPPAAPLAFEPAPWPLGWGSVDGDDEAQARTDAETAPPRGFVFDNEVGRHVVPTAAFSIDRQVRRWDDVLAFVEAGGYDERRFWSDAGWAWRLRQPTAAPRYLRRDEASPSGWAQWWHGRWGPLDRREAARHLTHHEAEAWCRWAGRRLPTEAEWERAALTQPGLFAWGEVWEWTASSFAAFPGFAPHPYRDYSAPWFDGRPVLRGASFMTQPRMKHPRYRNFFQPHRNDVAAGLRSCAL